MSTQNPLRQKSYAFSLEIISLYKSLKREHEYNLSTQILRSGTSVGANIEEANQAQSKRDFLSKISIALKEACETHYWLRLLRDSAIGDAARIPTLIEYNEELIRMLTSVTKSTKQSLINTPKE